MVTSMLLFIYEHIMLMFYTLYPDNLYEPSKNDAVFQAES